jgi:hypothetical protein
MDNEIALMSQMEHPNVIQHMESYEDDNYVFIIMEPMLEGVELKHLMMQKFIERGSP